LGNPRECPFLSCPGRVLLKFVQDMSRTKFSKENYIRKMENLYFGFFEIKLSWACPFKICPGQVQDKNYKDMPGQILKGHA